MNVNNQTISRALGLALAAALLLGTTRRVLPDAVPPPSAPAAAGTAAPAYGWISGACAAPSKGDRYVVEAMRREGAMLGGEQSGHLIFRGYSTTGDGLLAALQILRIMRQRGRPLSELAGLLVPYPQELRNVHVEHKIPFEENAEIADAVARIEEGLEGRGRVLLRYSGTEPLCRVMVEGQDADKVRVYANELAGIVEKALG